MAKEKICGIYKIENLINKKVYIGSSIDICRRWKEHKRQLSKNSHINNYLQNAWNKYMEYNFIFYIIELCEYNSLINREQCWIDYYNSSDYKFGYNINPNAGSNLGVRWSDETKLNMKLGKQHLIKPIVQISLDGYFIKLWENGAREIQDELGFDRSCISLCCNHKINTFKNYIWIFNKEYEKVKFDINNHINKSSKIIIQLDTNYNFISTWNSIHLAARDLNLNQPHITQCCQGLRNHCGGFKWLYKYDYDKGKLNQSTNNRVKYYKSIVQLDTSNNYINTWLSISEAGSSLNISIQNIQSVCANKRNTAGGYKWMYLDDYNKKIS